MTGRVEGLDDVLQELNRQVAGIKSRTMDGLFAGGLIIQGDAQKRAPVDTGNLRGSAYTRRALAGNGVEIGFTADYAAAVHEAVKQSLKGQPRADFGTTAGGQAFGGGSGKGKYWDSGEPKFLENAVRENLDRVLDEIRRRAGV